MINANGSPKRDIGCIGRPSGRATRAARCFESESAPAGTVRLFPILERIEDRTLGRVLTRVRIEEVRMVQGRRGRWQDSALWAGRRLSPEFRGMGGSAGCRGAAPV